MTALALSEFHEGQRGADLVKQKTEKDERHKTRNHSEWRTLS
jgi:hypothetical protein